MGLTLQSFLLFLRNLVSFFRKKWDQSNRKLWYIFVLLRSRLSLRHQAKRDEVLRSGESQSAKPSPTTVICASRLPPPLTPIIGGDAPIIASPTPISIRVRQPTILSPEDSVDEPLENGVAGHRTIDGYFLEEGRQTSGPPNSADHDDECDSMRPGGFASNSSVIPSRPPSQCSYRPVSKCAGYRTGSHHSHRPSSDHPNNYPTNLSGAEAAARGYLTIPSLPRPSSPALSVRPPSIAGSVASYVYRASRPSSRVRRPSPMGNAPRRRDRSLTPAPVHQSVDDIVPDIREPRPESRAGYIHRERHNLAISFGPSPPSPQKGKLRPMIGIDRYEKHKNIIVESVVNNHVCPPVTTQFVRWVFTLPYRALGIYFHLLSGSAPEDWIPLMHPEGALYWVHETNVSLPPCAHTLS